MLTGIKDLNREILNKIDDTELLKVCQINKRFYYDVCDDNYLRRRLSKYPNIDKYKGRENWKQFFLKVNFYISKLKNFYFIYSSGDFIKQYNLINKTDNMNDLLVTAAEAGELNVVIYASKWAGMHHWAAKMASKHGHLEIVKYLVEKGVDIHDDTEALLFYAADNGHLEIVKYLVEKGADIHVYEDEAFRWASRNGYYDIVKYLVEYGVDIHVQNDFALKGAKQNNHTKIVEYLESLFV